MLPLRARIWIQLHAQFDPNIPPAASQIERSGDFSESQLYSMQRVEWFHLWADSLNFDELEQNRRRSNSNVQRDGTTSSLSSLKWRTNASYQKKEQPPKARFLRTETRSTNYLALCNRITLRNRQKLWQKWEEEAFNSIHATLKNKQHVSSDDW